MHLDMIHVPTKFRACRSNGDEGLIFSNFLGGASEPFCPARPRNPQNTKFFTSPDMRAKFGEFLSMLQPRKWRLLYRKNKKLKKIKAASSDGRALAHVARRGVRRPRCIFCSSAGAAVYLLRCFVKVHFLLPVGGAMTVGDCRHVHEFRMGLLSYL